MSRSNNKIVQSTFSFAVLAFLYLARPLSSRRSLSLTLALLTHPGNTSLLHRHIRRPQGPVRMSQVARRIHHITNKRLEHFDFYTVSAYLAPEGQKGQRKTNPETRRSSSDPIGPSGERLRRRCRCRPRHGTWSR